MKVPICETCAVALPNGIPCPNFWCGREDRGFDVVWAIGAHDGPLRRAIAGLKYRHEPWQAPVLGTLLAGWLLDHAPAFDDVELIVGVPGSAQRDHTRRILKAAEARIGDLWPLDADNEVLGKRAETRTMVSTHSSAVRRLWAAGDLRNSLRIVDVAAVEARRVLAVDDVFTDGSTMREVALALRAAGAASVSGLVLARQPMRPGKQNRW